MKLFDLFEQEDYSQPLEPGQKRPRADLQMRDLLAIQTKIFKLLDSLESSQALKDQFADDTVLQQALEQLEKRVNLKIEYLSKMKARPTSSQSRVLNILKTECSDFLEMVMYKDKFLYRGTKNIGSAYEGRSREDRRSKDSSDDVSRRFDQAMVDAGFKALRSNSIFTTTDKNFAGQYGHTLYLIFPTNGANYLTTNTKDLILDSYAQLADDDLLRAFKNNFQQWLEQNVPNWRDWWFGRYLTMSRYDSLLGELAKTFENPESNVWKIPQQFNVDWDHFVSNDSIISNFEPSNNIAESMESGAEILVNGEYYAFRRDDWENFLYDAFID